MTAPKGPLGSWELELFEMVEVSFQVGTGRSSGQVNLGVPDVDFS